MDTIGRITFATCQEPEEPEYKRYVNAPSQGSEKEAYKRGVIDGLELAMKRIRDVLDDMT